MATFKTNKISIKEANHNYIYSTKTKEFQLGSLTKILIFLFFALKPLYLWDSGLPQFSDFFIIPLVALLLLDKKSKVSSAFNNQNFTAFIAFVIWIILVNMVAAFILSELSILRHSIIYFYDLICALTIIYFITNYQRATTRIIFYGVFYAVLIQFIVIVSSSAFTSRSLGLFNNPNQLAYFSILSAASLIILNNSLKFSGIVAGIGIMLSTISGILSMSRSGLLGIMVLLLGMYVWPSGTKKSNKNIRFMIMCSSLITFIIIFFSTSLKSTEWFQVLLARITKDSSAEIGSDRGYERLFKFPEYWFTGLGEGAYWRFDSNMELHSTLGNILLSYGLIGLIIFFYAIHKILIVNSYMYFYIIVAVFMYGLAHNGLRNTLLWIIFVLIAIPIASRKHTKQKSFKKYA